MDYWIKQVDKPLFPDIEWNKPERREQAGRLLIVGGSQQGLGAPAESYESVKSEGIGQVLIALPDKVRRLVGSTLPEATFLPSTITGEFSQEGEQELVEYALRCDTLLLPGDIGRNSQTTILMEQLLRSYNGLAIITRDVVDILAINTNDLLKRPHTTLIITLAQLQKLVKVSGATKPVTYTMEFLKLVELLHELTKDNVANIGIIHQNQLIIASGGQVSSTKLSKFEQEPPHWRTKLASLSACYQTWNPNKQFEALCYAAFRVAAIL